MRNMRMGLVSLDQQNNHGIMDDDDDEGENQDSSLGSNSSSDNLSNFSSSDSELFGEELGGVEDSTDPNSPNSSSDGGQHGHTIGGLQNMSTLLQQLPFKRGLSKHYNGKSQSFTSLSNVRSLEDMAKPENPYNKKLKSCKSYAVFSLEEQGFKSDHVIRSTNTSSSSSRLSSSSKRGSCSSLSRSKRNGSFLGNITSTSKPPVPPHRSTSTTSFTTQTPLFA